MILETIRIVVDALEHSSEGVNAELQSIPIDSGDARPPDIVSVLDPTQSDAAARQESGDDWPVLLVDSVREARSEALQSQTNIDANSIPLGIAYITHDPDSAESVQDTLYTLRAVLRAVNNLQDRDSDRKRNDVQILKPNEAAWREIPGGADLGPGTATGMVMVDFHVRDLSP